jgi:hypothetical protein
MMVDSICFVVRNKSTNQSSSMSTKSVEAGEGGGLERDRVFGRLLYKYGRLGSLYNESG